MRRDPRMISIDWCRLTASAPSIPSTRSCAAPPRGRMSTSRDADRQSPLLSQRPGHRSGGHGQVLYLDGTGLPKLFDYVGAPDAGRVVV